MRRRPGIELHGGEGRARLMLYQSGHAFDSLRVRPGLAATARELGCGSGRTSFVPINRLVARGVDQSRVGGGLFQ